MFEPNLIASDNSNNTSSDSSSSSFINQISFPVTKNCQLDDDDTQTTHMHITWQTFQELLEKSLDLHTFRETIAITQECTKLDNHLNSEFQLNENHFYFSSQKDVITYLNKTLRKRLFSVIRSTELFSQQKKDLVRILTSKLSTANLSDVLANFEFLEREYYKLVESIKSRLKLRIAKLENHLNVWCEFDNTCQSLNKVFEEINTNSIQITSSKFIEILSEISNHLKSLKDSLNTLSSTCSESKYFEMKNQIIQHEMKFNQLRDEHDNAKQFQLRYFTRTTEYQEDYENNYYESNVTSNQCAPEKTPVTINSQRNVLRNRNRVMQRIPQTEKLHARPRCSIMKKKQNQNYENGQGELKTLTPVAVVKMPVETCDKSTFTVSEIATQTEQQFHSNHQFYSIKLNSKMNNVNLNGSTEIDGKKLLLEAYLRNNTESHLVHNENSNMESSQSSNSGLLTSAAPNKKRKSLTTTDTRESGIGTYMDDEIATSSCDLDFLKIVDQNQKQNLHNTTDNESKTNDNNSSINGEYYRNTLNSKKAGVKSKSQKLQKLSKSDPKVEQFDCLRDLSESESSPKTGWFSWFFKTLFTFLLFFLTIIFVVMVYVFYSLVLNPSCCDYQRNYLMFNLS